MTATLDDMVCRSYMEKYVVRILRYISAVGEKIGQKKALRIYAHTEWTIGRNWIKENLAKLDITDETPKAAWELVKQSIRRFDPRPINPSEIQILEDTPHKLVIRRNSWCPIMEACKELKLPVEEIYPNFIIQNADAMIKTLNPKLSIKIGKIKPEKNIVEFIIELEE